MPLYKHPYKGIYEDYISSWGNDEECEKYEKAISEWLDQCEDERDEKLFLTFLKNFKMLRGKIYQDLIIQLFDKFQSKYLNWKTNAIFVEPKKDENSVGNSDIFFADFWRYTGIRQYATRNFLESPIDSNINHIVLVDDYSGSGNTLITFIDALLDKHPCVAKKRITILVLVCSHSAEIALTHFALFNGLNIDIMCAETQQKAFSPDVIFNKRILNDSIDHYDELCTRFKLKYGRGYENTEALLGFEYSVPNNTLGICWENRQNGNNKLFKGFLARTETVTLQLLKDRKKKNSKAISSIKFKDAAISRSDYLFMGCCIASKKKLNAKAIQKAFGLTERLYLLKLDLCLDRGYMALKDGAFVATDKFYDNIKSSLGRKFFISFLKDNETSFEEEPSIEYTLKYIDKNFAID